MRAKVRNFTLLATLITSYGFLSSSHGKAQTFKTLHNFPPAALPPVGDYTNSDGVEPMARLIVSGNTLYGTTYRGGIFGNGTIFAVNADGTGFKVLHSFTPTSGNPYTNSDGANPIAGLILSSNVLYGTTSAAYGGGGGGEGAVFAVNTDGTGFTNLHSFTALSYPFTNSDGADPRACLVLSDNTLYGTVAAGGSSDDGTVFAVNTDGTSFTNLHSFTGGSDGRYPLASLIVSGGAIYGTASAGGSSNSGTIFKLNIDGTGFTNFYNFSTKQYNTNSDGGGPGSLILSGNTLYGVASVGGPSGNGTVFKVNTDGSDFKVLHSFSTTHYPHVNNDGAEPNDVLILLENTLYGTTYFGGSWGAGVVFAVNTDGTGFTNVYSFTGGNDGGNPHDGLIYSRIALYGTAIYGGSSGDGTVFSLSFAPQLTLNFSDTNVILTWPTNVAGFDYTGFTLQCATNLAPSAVWTNVSPLPTVINGEETVTNPFSSTQTFYRLAQ